MLKINSINCDHSKVADGYEGQAIRVAYLFGDLTVVSGTTFIAIDFEEQFALGSVGERLKHRLIEIFCDRLNPPVPVAEFHEVLKTLKTERTIKYKDKSSIVYIKQTEKIIDTLYTDCMNYYRHALIPTGLTELIKLDEKELTLVAASDLQPETNKEGYTPYSAILKSKWTGDDELYIFTPPFLEFVKENNIDIQPVEKAAGNTGIVLFPLPEITIVTFFKAAELQLIKQQVFNEIQPLRLALEQWSKNLRQEEFSPSQFEAYEQYFTTQLEQPLQLLKEKIVNNEALKKINDFYKGTNGSHNYLGIAPAKTVWEYMEWSGIVPKESMHVFMENLPEENLGNKAVLFFICHSFKNMGEEEEVSDKKHLEL